MYYLLVDAMLLFKIYTVIFTIKSSFTPVFDQFTKANDQGLELLLYHTVSKLLFSRSERVPEYVLQYCKKIPLILN